MIDLRMTREEMLVAIGAHDASGVQPAETAPCMPAVLTDPLAPAFCTAPHVRLAVRGHTRDDLFPVLKVVLAARFAAVPPARLTRDLLAPLKNGLGNAYKRGNARDRSKSIDVVVDATAHGVVLAITDAGAGFDVAGAVQRHRSQERAFQGHGAGFRAFDQCGSVVSYADNGRTFQLCFRVDDDTAGATHPAPAWVNTTTAERRPVTPLAIDSELPRAPDVDLQRRLRVALAGPGSLLATRLSRCMASSKSIDAGLRIEDLHLFGPTAMDAAVRCVVRCRVDTEVVPMVLTGLRFDSSVAARADFAIGRALFAGLDAQKVRIPEPIVCLQSDRLVFSAFDPWMDLWTYVDQRGEAGALLRLGEHLGACLRDLHHAPGFDSSAHAVEDWRAVVETWKYTGEQALRTVAAALPERHPDTARLVDALIEQSGRMAPRAPLLIHGHFGADTIHYGVDGRYYLTRFDGCHRSHPGLDVGSALADLLVLVRSPMLASSAPSDRDLYDAFMQSYLMSDACDWKEDLRFFVIAALLSRLVRLGRRRDVGKVLDLCSSTWSS